MALILSELPYPRAALEPHMSRETLNFHYGKHHKTYVDKANELIKDTKFETMPIEEIIRKSSGKVFNNVAQAWNHAFFWQCLTPRQTPPGAKLSEMLEQQFGGLEKFKQQFAEAGVNVFGSGWVWLVRKTNGSLAIVAKQGAGNPLTSGQQPLLACDVWEHAYYIDYRNARPEYLERFWRLVNWEFVAQNLQKEFRAGSASRKTAARDQRPAIH